MEKLAGDLLFGLKFVKLSILPTLFIHFVWHRLGELRSRYLRIKGLTKSLIYTFVLLFNQSINQTLFVEGNTK